MPTDTKLNNLVINYLTQAQYDSATKNENELYLTPDATDTTYGKLAGDNTWTGENTFSTISTTYASFNIAHEPSVWMNRISIASTTEGEMVVGPDQWAPTLFTGIAATYESDGDGTFFFGFDNHEKYNVPVLCYRGSAVIRSYLMGNEGTDVKYEYTLPKKSGTFAFTSDIKETYLHTITAIGATLSISFTYPSANNLVVDSAQDASTVIKPTANEYFPSPVVVIATNKLSDSCNCVYYNGTIWKFAMWNGTAFTDIEAVTTWKDSVVVVD